MNPKLTFTVVVLSIFVAIGAMGNYIMTAKATSPTQDPQPKAEPPQLRIESQEIAPGVILLIAVSPTGNCDIEVVDLRSTTTVSKSVKEAK